MTTIVRYKNLIASDSKYLSMIGDMIGKINGPAKFYLHPSKLAVIGLGGGFGNKTLFDTVEKDISQAIVDLKSYPDVVPGFEETIKLMADEKQLSNAKRDQLPTLMIVTMDHTCTVLWCEDALDKPIISVYPQNLPVSIGTGSDTILPLLQSINTEDSLIEAMRLAIMGDSLSGNDIFICDISDMGRI